ncbi:MAG: hypothetical protein E6Q99_04545 [Elusimicrobia bacterium]|nr:MAG: hypothetical protein E6Q99_04545 [Elusimicrobiota bacterium]
MKQLAIISMLLAVASTEAGAQNLDGNTLYDACTQDDLGKQSFCVGYILGIVEGVKWGSFLNIAAVDTGMNTDEANQFSDKILGFCSPANAELRQHVDIVVQYLEAHPESRHESARWLVTEAFRKSFPCSP